MTKEEFPSQRIDERIAGLGDWRGGTLAWLHPLGRKGVR